LTTEELNLHKNEMEKGYIKNAVLPDSEGFVYDIQKSFENDNYENEWDEEL